MFVFFMQQSKGIKRQQMIHVSDQILHVIEGLDYITVVLKTR